MHSRPRRVGDYDVGMTMSRKEFFVEQVFDVTRVKLGVGDVVNLRVYLGVFYRLGDILKADDLAGLSGNKVGNGPRAGIKIKHEFMRPYLSHFGGKAVQMIGLTGIGLVERLGADP